MFCVLFFFLCVCVGFFFPLPCRTFTSVELFAVSGPAVEMQAAGNVLGLKEEREGGNRAGYDLHVTLICL